VEGLMDNAAKREKPKNNRKISKSKDSQATRAQKLATRVKSRKAPRQERSKVMVEAILEAAAQVFAELGYARATTNKIAERAGVSVGSLYQYFPNKDSLIASLHKAHHAKIHEVAGNALRRFGDHSIGLEEGLRRFLDELNEVHEADPTLTKALSREVMRESEVDETSHTDEDESAKINHPVMLLFNRPDVRDGDPAVIAAIMSQIISHLTRWLLHDAPPGLDRDALREETVQLLLRYLKK
jgi:AcrR family transcriptional regulator